MKRHESEACVVTESAIDWAASLALSVLMVDVIKKVTVSAATFI